VRWTWRAVCTTPAVTAVGIFGYVEVVVVCEIKLQHLFLAVAFLVASPVMASADPDLPVKGVITSGVGWRLDPFGTGRRVFHRGIDIAVPVGTPVHATRKGRVILAGDDHHGHGFTVIVEQENGDRTLYGHNSVVLVHKGEQVASGAVLALSGSSGRSTGPHVHYEQQPGGRPYPAEKTEVAATVTHRSDQSGSERRRLLEQKMDDSVDSIIRAIGSTALSGPGG
jgi:murein DD-endopeptidase MepM/ murein hydrolase activator NlpD